MSKKTLMAALAVVLTCLGLSACASSDDSGGGDGYRVALSMSYSGNDWQTEARNLIQVAAEKEPLADRIDELEVFVSGTEAQNQISQIQQMIADQYDVIVLYPISPTALNGVIKQGCDAGILMMTYDASVTEPCAHNVTFDQSEAGTVTAEELADLMGNEGNVVMITGVAGTSVDEDRTSAAEAVFAERGITVLDKCAGDWAQGPAGECMNRFLAAFDDIDGVWAQVGGPAVIDALDAAGKDYVPILSESENRFLLALADEEMQAKGLTGASYGSPPWQGAAALRMAIDSLEEDQDLEPTIDVGYPFVTQDEVQTCEEGTTEDMEEGCNAFTSSEVSAGFMADWYSSEWTEGITLEEVRTGEATG